jgi:hypothetical protein
MPKTGSPLAKGGLSADQKVAPSQTRHKNATEAGQFDREVAEAKQGGGAGPNVLIKGHTVRPPCPLSLASSIGQA